MVRNSRTMLPCRSVGMLAMEAARKRQNPPGGPYHPDGRRALMGMGRLAASPHPLAELANARTAQNATRRRIGGTGKEAEDGGTHTPEEKLNQGSLAASGPHLRSEQDPDSEGEGRFVTNDTTVVEDTSPKPRMAFKEEKETERSTHTTGLAGMSTLIRRAVTSASDRVRLWCSPRKKPIEELRQGTPSPLTLPRQASKRSVDGKRLGVLALARTARNSKRAVTELEADFAAESSRKSTLAVRRTIRTTLKEARPGEEVVPASAEKLKLLAGILKKAEYRAGHIYLGEYKLMHIEAGFTWTGLLDRTLQQCKRAMQRRIGPNAKASEVETAEEGKHFTKPKDVRTTKGHVLLAKELFEFSIIWMLRRIETNLVEDHRIQLDFERRKVTLNLPVSKTDQKGEGVRRVLQCTCSTKVCNIACPFYVSARLLDAMAKLDTKKACVLRGGKLANKNQLTHSWKALYGKGTSGHSARRTGALRYIKQGWTIAQVA